MAPRKYYIGIDVGTTNWKTALFDDRGKMLDIERCPTITHMGKNGFSYYDPQEMWEVFLRLMRTVISRNPVQVSGISVASVAESVVPVGRDGRIVDNIITWYDTRSYEQAQKFRERFGEDRIFEICGLDCNPIFSLPKIMWVRDNEPEIYEKAAVWLQMADYIVYRLTGELVTDYTLASRTLAYDVRKNDWSDEILSAFGFDRSLFPRIEESGTVVGKASREVCDAIGLKEAPVVAVGGHDHPVGSIVTGAIQGNKVLDSSGTAEAYLYISKPDRVPVMKSQGQRTCRYLEKSRYVLWGGIISSGRSFDWAYQLLTTAKAFGLGGEKPSYDTILPQLEDVKGIEEGLLFYPHLRGAGAPYWDPRMRGSFVGVRDYMDNRHFMRAVLEGLCMQSRMIVDMHEKISGDRIDHICVVGGSSKNRLWQQLKANITGRNVELCFEPEATALGAAMLAAMGDGVYGSLEEISDCLARENQVVEPESGAFERYTPFYELYREGYEALEGINEKIYTMVGK